MYLGNLDVATFKPSQIQIQMTCLALHLVMVVVVVVAFSSLASILRDLRECSTVHSLPTLVSFSFPFSSGD